MAQAEHKAQVAEKSQRPSKMVTNVMFSGHIESSWPGFPKAEFEISAWLLEAPTAVREAGGGRDLECLGRVENDSLDGITFHGKTNVSWFAKPYEPTLFMLLLSIKGGRLPSLPNSSNSLTMAPRLVSR